MHRSSRPVWWAVTLVVVVVLSGLSIGGGRATAPVTPATATAESPSVHPSSTPNGNLSISIPQPIAQVVPGTYLVSQYRVSVVSNLTELPPVLTIWVPQTIALFHLPTQSLQVIGSARVINISQGGPYISNDINGTVLVKLATSFNTTSDALLTSQLLSFMYSAPDSAFGLAVTWRWAIFYPDGSSEFGPWSQSPEFPGVQYAAMVSYGPTKLPPQGWFQVCMAASGVTRQFSLHLETISPVDDFIHAEQNVSANASAPVCWSAQVAPWVTPQPLIAHLWAYDQLTFLMYLVKVYVVNQTGLAGPLSILTTWNGVATVGALAVAAGLVVWGIRHTVVRRRPAQSPKAAEPPPGSKL
jgi:hypothetical protein